MLKEYPFHAATVQICRVMKVGWIWTALRPWSLSESSVVEFAFSPHFNENGVLFTRMTAGIPAYWPFETWTTTINTSASRHCPMKCATNPGLCVVERLKPESFNMCKTQTGKFININKSLQPPKGLTAFSLSHIFPLASFLLSKIINISYYLIALNYDGIAEPKSWCDAFELIWLVPQKGLKSGIVCHWELTEIIVAYTARMQILCLASPSPLTLHLFGFLFLLYVHASNFICLHFFRS